MYDDAKTDRNGSRVSGLEIPPPLETADSADASARDSDGDRAPRPDSQPKPDDQTMWRLREALGGDPGPPPGTTDGKVRVTASSGPTPSPTTPTGVKRAAPKVARTPSADAKNPKPADVRPAETRTVFWRRPSDLREHAAAKLIPRMTPAEF